MLTIIGCGNPNRSDDGVGVVVAQRLQERFRKHPVPGVQVFDCGTGGVDVMFRAKGSEALLIIDASQTGSSPGTIYSVPGDELASNYQASFNLHDFRWDNALFAGRKIFKDAFPKDVKVWLVEAESVELGLGLSPSVQESCNEVYRRALRLAADYSVARHKDVAIDLEVCSGSVRITKPDYDKYFSGRDSVVLLENEGRIALMPVEPVSGGLLIKQRNAAGDRVIPMQEALERCGIGVREQRRIDGVWDESLGAVVLDFGNQRTSDDSR